MKVEVVVGMGMSSLPLPWLLAQPVSCGWCCWWTPPPLLPRKCGGRPQWCGLTPCHHIPEERHSSQTRLNYLNMYVCWLGQANCSSWFNQVFIPRKSNIDAVMMRKQTLDWIKAGNTQKTWKSNYLNSVGKSSNSVQIRRRNDTWYINM